MATGNGRIVLIVFLNFFFNLENENWLIRAHKVDIRAEAQSKDVGSNVSIIIAKIQSRCQPEVWNCV